MIVIVHCIVRMGMRSLFAVVNVGMRMDMGMFMCMRQIAIAMLVIMDMRVLMGVLEGDGILDHQHRCCDHDDKAKVKLYTGTFTQKQHSEYYAKKGRNYFPIPSSRPRPVQTRSLC